MKRMSRRLISTSIAALLVSSMAYAEPVWHCSRNGNSDITDASAQVQAPSLENQFSIASYNSSAEAIGVSVRDLIDIYTGTPVSLGGLPLSGCFLVKNESLTVAALTSLGIKPNTIEALARRSSIVQSNLHHVTDETQMSSCIAKNFPAVGYLSVGTHTSKLMPCF